MGVALIGYSFPSFFIGLLLLFFVADQVAVWSATPATRRSIENPSRGSRRFILPWITLALLYAAFYARLTRNQMLETLGEDYIRTARAKGLPERTVIGQHALRAGLTPIVTAAGLDLGRPARWRDHHRGSLQPPRARAGCRSTRSSTSDLPVIVGTVLVAAIFVIVANLIVDVLYAVIDPGVRLT